MGEQKRRYVAQDGLERTVIFDLDEPDRFTIKTSQDIGPLRDAIAYESSLPRRRNPAKNEKIATLPLFVVEDLIHRGIYHDEDAFKKWLNSSECTPWRIYRGTV